MIVLPGTALLVLLGCGGSTATPDEASGVASSSSSGAGAGGSGAGGSGSSSSGTGGGPSAPCDTSTWSRALHDNTQSNYPTVAVDADCGVIVSGEFRDTIDLGGGPLNGGDGALFLARYDSAGSHLWSRRLEGTGWHRVAWHPDGMALVGHGSTTADLGCGPFPGTVGVYGTVAWVALLDAQGDCIWSRSVPSALGSGPTNLAVGPQGDIVLVGEFKETIDLGTGPLTSAGYKDGFVAKLTPTGEVLWVERLGGPNLDELRGVAVNEAGSILLGGGFYGTMTVAGSVLESGDSHAGLVVGLSSEGEYAHGQVIHGGEAGASVSSVAAGTDGLWLAAGIFEGFIELDGLVPSAGDYDGFVVALDSNGTRRWATTFGGAGRDWVDAVASDPWGNALVAGVFKLPGGSPGAPEDTALIKYGPSGELLASRGFGRPFDSWDRGTAIVTDRAGQAILAGRFRHTADLGTSSGPMVETGPGAPKNATFVARIDLSLAP